MKILLGSCSVALQVIQEPETSVKYKTFRAITGLKQGPKAASFRIRSLSVSEEFSTLHLLSLLFGAVPA